MIIYVVSTQLTKKQEFGLRYMDLSLWSTYCQSGFKTDHSKNLRLAWVIWLFFGVRIIETLRHPKEQEFAYTIRKD